MRFALAGLMAPSHVDGWVLGTSPSMTLVGATLLLKAGAAE
jgi:hypothetical protein